MAKVKVPVHRARLANGLRVIVAPEKGAPGVYVSATYDGGMRSEPEGRTGFAHLFEHLMFQGSATLEKGRHDELTTGNGGDNNGSTWPDFTNYFQEMPANALELTLFLEADRMRAIRLSEETLRNQVDVVKDEIKLNIMNAPYGGFDWLYHPQVLFETFPNAHDGYGHFADLEAATLADAQAFFDRYYAPGNCVLAVVGGADVDETMGYIERHFGDIPPRAVPPVIDASEPMPRREKRLTKMDPHAPDPAVLIAWRAPDPIHDVDRYLAAMLLNDLLVAGDSSRLTERLVKRERIATDVGGHIGAYPGSALMVRDPVSFCVTAVTTGAPDPDRILRVVDEEISRLADGIDPAELARVRTAWRSGFLHLLGSPGDRGHLLSAYELQHGDAALVLDVPARIEALRPQDLVDVATTYLLPNARAVLDWRPGA
jgi:zinc protease